MWRYMSRTSIGAGTYYKPSKLLPPIQISCRCTQLPPSATKWSHRSNNPQLRILWTPSELLPPPKGWISNRKALTVWRGWLRWRFKINGANKHWILTGRSSLQLLSRMIQSFMLKSSSSMSHGSLRSGGLKVNQEGIIRLRMNHSRATVSRISTIFS